MRGRPPKKPAGAAIGEAKAPRAAAQATPAPSTPPPSGPVSTGPVSTRVTPVMRQFGDAKSQYPDAIIFFRLGDFYEMFHEDAVVASSVLGITLTSRNKEDPASEPMCGVPHHSAHSYIARLLAAGHKVAICEQLADPSKVKGIVPRAVVRVITPGLVTDETQLDARANHFLAAVEAPDAGGESSVALLDLSTAELLVSPPMDPGRVVAELARAQPREVLLAPGVHGLAQELGAVIKGVPVRPLTAFAREPAAVLAEVLGPEAAADAAREHSPLALLAAARVLDFAARCSPRFGVPVRRVGLLDTANTMHVDEVAQAHLEIVRSLDGSTDTCLLAVVDRSVTSAGARLLRRRLLAPLADVARIRARLAEVEAFVLHPRVRAELREALAKVPDLERIGVKLALRQASPRDLGNLRDGLARAPEALAAVLRVPESERSLLGLGAVDTLGDLYATLDGVLIERPPVTERDGGFVRDGVDRELDAARTLQRSGTELIVKLEASLREETGAQGLRVRYNSVFGWYIEVTKSQLAKVPAAWRRKQTVAGGERFTTPELDQLAADLESAEERALAREAEIWERVTDEARRADARLRHLARVLAEWDVAAALAELAHEQDYRRPEIDDGEAIDIVEGRHPVVEAHVARGRFVPNDTRLDLEAGRLWLVTGPNMAGKSTLMRQVALIVLLAQCGSYVPAKSARVGVIDRLLSRVGASDNLARGESTFMVEMRETASILRHATRRSLVILDEIGRGTSTYDGLAIAWAVAEHLHDAVGCRALFATHYHELTELASSREGVVNVSVSAREHAGGVVFLHTLVKGPASRSYGIAVAKLAGVPEAVLARARALLAAFEGEDREGEGTISTRAPRRTKAKAQLGLFGPTEATRSESSERSEAIVSTLRQLDVDRLTPLEALTLLAKWKSSL